MEKLARFGLVAQGISFGLVAVLAIELALGEGGKATDREGALQTIAPDGIGRVIVFVLAFGFGAYALWRLAQVFLGHDVEEPGGRTKWGKRLSSLAKAAIYGALCWFAFSILLANHGGGSNKEQEATKGIFGWPGGRWIVYGIALGIAGAALWNSYRAVSGGLDGALGKLANAPYGTALLSIVAAGLFAYGLFCVIQARYREV